ncbi:MAG: PaaI family thioesterase [Dehalococcoidia bacterium]|jgi:acyl-CoA thioesterase|nr:PaaI family thioesterase [Dehalococcoidia bacterium]
MASRGHRPDRISPFAKLVGLSFPETDVSQCELKIEEKVLNVYGTVHGGAISTMADISMGLALFDHLREDERLATVEMKINYVAAVSSGVLTAEAMLVNRTRNLAVMESRVECGGKLVAKAVGTFYISKKTPRESP